MKRRYIVGRSTCLWCGDNLIGTRQARLCSFCTVIIAIMLYTALINMVMS